MRRRLKCSARYARRRTALEVRGSVDATRARWAGAQKRIATRRADSLAGVGADAEPIEEGQQRVFFFRVKAEAEADGAAFCPGEPSDLGCNHERGFLRQLELDVLSETKRNVELTRGAADSQIDDATQAGGFPTAGADGGFDVDRKALVRSVVAAPVPHFFRVKGVGAGCKGNCTPDPEVRGEASKIGYLGRRAEAG